MTDYSRKLYIIGDISDESYKEFVEALDGMEDILEDDDILIELHSHGGCAMAALAFYDRIKRIKGEVTIEAYGLVASAAVLVLAAGDTRKLSKNSWVMVHEDTVAVKSSMSVSQVEKNAKVSRQFEIQWAKILAIETHTSARQWEELHKEEKYFTANDCLDLGLIEEII